MGAMSEVNIHASCVAIGARGVCCWVPAARESQILALRLIDHGAKLVATIAPSVSPPKARCMPGTGSIRG